MKALILHIDTALENGTVFLSEKEKVLEVKRNTEVKDHARWIHGAIDELLRPNGQELFKPSAVAVTIGPGSYTGLRVGLATAKGICFALGIPLIAVGVLPLIATAVKNESSGLICPMVDARRMEVFTALYDKEGKVLLAPSALVVEADSFNTWLPGNKILFAGNGSNKVQAVIRHPHANFTDSVYQPEHMVELALKDYHAQRFADIAYTEPFYIKEFYTGS